MSNFYNQTLIPNDMKTILSLLLIAILAGGHLKGQVSGNYVIDAILSGYSVRSYISEPVTDQQLDLILKCGIKAPSSQNRQPWKFTVIKDEATMKEIINNVVPGNVLIVVSGVESQEGGRTPDFDCGLATHSMFIAAEGLGLGARIYGSPIGNINSKREVYQIPAGYKAVIVLRIGNIEKSVDAVSAATPRKTSEEVINYKK
jgi:nitroreductase